MSTTPELMNSHEDDFKALSIDEGTKENLKVLRTMLGQNVDLKTLLHFLDGAGTLALVEPQ